MPRSDRRQPRAELRVERPLQDPLQRQQVRGPPRAARRLQGIHCRHGGGASLHRLLLVDKWDAAARAVGE